MYGHVNNAVYYAYFDTCVNHFLINEAGLRPMESAGFVEGQSAAFAARLVQEFLSCPVHIYSCNTEK